MSLAVKIMMTTVLLAEHALLYSKVITNYDQYGIKIALNDGIVVSADNIDSMWFTSTLAENSSVPNMIHYNATTCDFVYSTVVPIGNNSLFVYNCIDLQQNNVIGFFASDATHHFWVIDEQIISNYSVQDNFIIAVDGNGTGVYGFADDFTFFYELQSPFLLTVYPNTYNISPRALDIGSNMQYAVLVGYFQSKPSIAIECGAILALNGSLSAPHLMSTIPIGSALKYNWSDPRVTRLVTQSRVYSTDTMMSVSIAWRTRQILIGIQSLNIVLLYALDSVSQPISTRQNGIGFSGFGKSVAWLDDQGKKAAILANSYVYSTEQWISSFVHIYDIESDGFTSDTQPVHIYPNSEQILFPFMNTVFIRLICSKSGHLAIFDNLGNAAIILSASPGMYPNTRVPWVVSSSVPCIRGTHRNYSGIELCMPCPNGTFSSGCQRCATNNSFCPYGSVQDLSYSSFESIDQDQDYPESPENTLFDDLLMQNMFSLNTQSAHCVRVSPMTWVLVVLIFGLTLAIVVVILETHCPGSHGARNQFKRVMKKVDLIGEGEVSQLSSMANDRH